MLPTPALRGYRVRGSAWFECDCRRHTSNHSHAPRPQRLQALPHTRPGPRIARQTQGTRCQEPLPAPRPPCRQCHRSAADAAARARTRTSASCFASSLRLATLWRQSTYTRARLRRSSSAARVLMCSIGSLTCERQPARREARGTQPQRTPTYTTHHTHTARAPPAHCQLRPVTPERRPARLRRWWRAAPTRAQRRAQSRQAAVLTRR